MSVCNQTYERIPHSEDDTSEPCGSCTSKQRCTVTRKRFWCTIIGAVVTGIILGASIVRALGFFKSPRPPTVQPLVVQYQHDNDVVYGCGNSTAEAKALGCRFNPLSMAWLRDECYDDDVTQAFLDAGPWQYFTDAAGEHEINIETVGLSADTGAENWLSKQWHMTHCAFMWQKMHRAMMSQERRLEPSLVNFGHTKHCGRVITHDLPREKLLTIITPQFEEC